MIRFANKILARFRRGVWRMLCLDHWLGLQKSELRAALRVMRECSARLEQQRWEIHALRTVQRAQQALIETLLPPKRMD